MNGGFGDSWNRRIMALPVLRGRMYALTSNRSGEGMQVWRSTNGQQWEEDAPAGFGNGNNTGPYWGNSVAVFGDRLFIGTSTDGVGNQIWQKTVTADFSAAPLTGRPPLAVSFSNASAGDVTSTQWDFGDGQTSTQANPAHTYAQTGAYTVRLTVGDGVDSHTLTRPAYVKAWYRNYLPAWFKGFSLDPAAYDSFDNPVYDGAWNPLLWRFDANSAFRAQQGNGVMTFTQTVAPAGEGASLFLTRPAVRSLQDLREFSARLRLSSDHSGGFATVQLHVVNYDIPNGSWWTQCKIGAGSDHAPFFACDVTSGNQHEYSTPATAVNYDTWHAVRIEFDPGTARLRFYLNNGLVASYMPRDAAVLVGSNRFRPLIGVWNGEANTTVTRYVDDVRITPAQ
jgi:PKD repeat protein